MVKLPSYVNNQALAATELNTGGFTRLNSPQTAIGDSVSRLGRAIGDFASVRAEQNERIIAKTEAQREADDRIRLEARLMDYTDGLQAEALKRQEDMPEGGFGYSSGLAEYAATEADTMIKQNFAHREDQEYVALRFQQARQGVLDQAAVTEFKTRLEWRGDVTGRKVSELSASVGADPENYGPAVKVWDDFVQSSIVAGENSKKAFRTLGMQKLARAELDARVARDPEAFRSAFRGSFENQPTQMAEPHIAGTITAANDAGIDPRTALAIGMLESTLDPKKGNPKREDGTIASSAIGMWQILAAPDTLNELGISKEDRTNYAVATPAIMRHLARNNERLKAAGISPTPGKTYMTWNIGPGAAMAVMRADPDASIETVLSRVWAHKGPAWVEQALGNNRHMYRRGMTVRQVIDNYERKVAGAEKSVQGYITGTNLTTDEQARAVFSSIGLKGGEFLTARDAAEVFIDVDKKLGVVSKEQAKINLGTSILNGDIAPDRYDTEIQSAVNDVAARTDLGPKVAAGDPDAMTEARKMTAVAGFIPAPILNGYREAINAAGDSPNKAMAYAALADIADGEPRVYDATKMPDDERSRINEYRAYTTTLQLSPATAIKRIEEARTPEGRKIREAMAEATKEELKSLSWSDIRAKFDASWFSTPQPVNDVTREVAVEAYRVGYRYHRETGRTPEEAKALSLQDMTGRQWGVTSLFGNVQKFTQFPVEQNFDPVEKSHKWVLDQAKNVVKTYLRETGKIKTQTIRGLGKVEEARDPEVMLIPRVETAQDFRANKPLRYELWYRRDDGMTAVIPDRWFTPDWVTAQSEANERFREQRARNPRPMEVRKWVAKTAPAKK